MRVVAVRYRPEDAEYWSVFGGGGLLKVRRVT